MRPGMAGSAERSCARKELRERYRARPFSTSHATVFRRRARRCSVVHAAVRAYITLFNDQWPVRCQQIYSP